MASSLINDSVVELNDGPVHLVTLEGGEVTSAWRQENGYSRMVRLRSEEERRQAKARAMIMVYKIPRSRRAVEELIEAEKTIGAREVVLMIEDIDPQSLVDNLAISRWEAGLLNNRRQRLRRLAVKQGVPVFEDFTQALNEAGRMAREMRGE